VTTNNETQELLDGRHAVYGDRIENMVRVAQIWSGILGFEVKPVQVPLMMAGYKMYRASITPDYSDNMDDIDGYVAIAREVVGEDMIKASTVAEYERQKKHRSLDPIELFAAVSRTQAQDEGEKISLWEQAQRPQP